MSSLFRFEKLVPKESSYESLLQGVLSRSLDELVDNSAQWEDQSSVDGVSYLTRIDSATGLVIPKSVCQVPFTVRDDAEKSAFVVTEAFNNPTEKKRWDDAVDSIEMLEHPDPFTGISHNKFLGVRFVVSPRDMVIIGRVTHIISDHDDAPFRRALVTYGCSYQLPSRPPTDSHTRATLHFFAFLVIKPEDGLRAPFKAQPGNLLLAQVSMSDLGGSISSGSSIQKIAAKKTMQSLSSLRQLLTKAVNAPTREINAQWISRLLAQNLELQKSALDAAAATADSKSSASSVSSSSMASESALSPSPPLDPEDILEMTFDPFATQGMLS